MSRSLLGDDLVSQRSAGELLQIAPLDSRTGALAGAVGLLVLLRAMHCTRRGLNTTGP